MINEDTIQKQDEIRRLLESIGLEVGYGHADPDHPSGHWFVVGGVSEFEADTPKTFKMGLHPAEEGGPLVELKGATPEQANRVMELMVPLQDQLASILAQ